MSSATTNDSDLRREFNKFDINGDGSLSADEFSKILAGMSAVVGSGVSQHYSIYILF